MSLVAESGGAPVLAHPALLHLAPHELADYVDRLVAAGLRGIEAYRPEHDDALREELCGTCARAGASQRRPAPTSTARPSRTIPISARRGPCRPATTRSPALGLYDRRACAPSASRG